MEGLEAFLPRERVEAITYIKVIFTVTFFGRKDRERGEQCWFFFLFFRSKLFQDVS